MTTNDDPQHRAYHQADPARVEVRETDEDGVFVVRMPIASTGDVRNQGDDPLSRDELEGMAEQVNDGDVGVFLDHGQNLDIGGTRYSAVGKVGAWQDAELVDDGDVTTVEAGARMMDPETLPAATGSLREALAAVKSQVERGIPLSSSIGWRDDDAFAGGVDLMEASIVGIPADPRTTSQDAAVSLARAVAASRQTDDVDVDVDALADQIRAVVMGPDDERHLSAQQAEIATELVDTYRNEQGNGSVENFESWLWNVAYHQFDENEFHAAHTALQEFFRETTPLEEPVNNQFVPFLSDRQDSGESGSDEDGDDEGGDARDSVTDDETEQSGDSPDDTNDDSDGMDDQEYRESMLEMQRQQTETLSTLAEAIREDSEDGEDDEDESGNGDDEDGDEEEDTQSAADEGSDRDADDELDVEAMVDDYREQLQAVRDGDVDPEDVDLGDAASVTEAADGGDASEDEQRDNQTNSTSADPGGWLE